MPAARCRGKPSWHRIASKFLPGLEVAGLFAGIFFEVHEDARCIWEAEVPRLLLLAINIQAANKLPRSPCPCLQPHPAAEALG